MDEPTPISLKIPSPCHKRWEELRGTGQERHCEQCQHSVFDLTNLSHQEIQSLIQSRGGKLCGMVRGNQLGVGEAVRTAAVSASTAVGLALAGCELTPVEVPPPPCTSENHQPKNPDEELFVGDISIEEPFPTASFDNVMLDTLGPR